MSAPPKMSPPPQSSPDLDLPPTQTTTVRHTEVHQVGEDSNAPQKPGVFTKERYRPMFDVEEKILLKRLFKSIVFCGGAFYGSNRSDKNNKPDLYGPFWIVTTIVLVMGVVGTFTRNHGDLDIKRVSYAALTFYIGWLLPSFILYWFLRWFNAKRGMSNIMSLYGYSFFIYIPCAIFTLIPIPNIDIITISIACGVSTLFVVKNVYCYFIMEEEHYSPFAVFQDQEQHETVDIAHSSDSDGTVTTTTTTATHIQTVHSPYIEEDGSNHQKPHKKIGLFLMLGVMAVHVAIAVLSYFFFFHITNDDNSTPDPTPDPTPNPNPAPAPPAPFVLQNFHRVFGIGTD